MAKEAAQHLSDHYASQDFTVCASSSEATCRMLKCVAEAIRNNDRSSLIGLQQAIKTNSAMCLIL